MKLFVNSDCIGCGLCVSTCPAAFSMTEQNVAVALDGDIPTKDEEAAREALNKPIQNLLQIMAQKNLALSRRGVRVGEITKRTHLSRPAVSHHLQILKDAGIVKMRREGTMNYCYFDADTETINAMLQMLTHARDIMQAMPDRSGDD